MISIGPNSDKANSINVGYISSLSCLDIDDGECDEIYAPEMMDYIHYDHLSTFLTSLLKKIRIGALITVGGTEYFEVCRRILHKRVSTKEANEILYGKMNERRKSSIYSIVDLCHVINHLGGDIISKYISEDAKYIIKFRRKN